MDTESLYISFWHICLDNLPEGTFRHRRIPSDEASRYIEQARQDNRLRCVSHDDLGAPYKKRQAENHEALCKVLSEHWGITLSFEEFFSRHDDEEGEALYFVNGLDFAQIHGESRLLVVTCSYVFAEEKSAGEPRGFDIDPASVKFHLFEAV
jgi:hypothetical protein